MTVTLTDSAGGSQLVLVHGPGRASDAYAQGPLGDTKTFDAAQQVDVWPQTRSDWALVLPRKNHQAAFPFAALREFATSDDACVWAARHALDVQGLTRLVLVGSAKTLRLHGGVTICKPTVRNIAVTIEYAFTYGRVEEVIP